MPLPPGRRLLALAALAALAAAQPTAPCLLACLLEHHTTAHLVHHDDAPTDAPCHGGSVTDDTSPSACATLGPLAPPTPALSFPTPAAVREAVTASPILHRVRFDDTPEPPPKR